MASLENCVSVHKNTSKVYYSTHKHHLSIRHNDCITVGQPQQRFVVNWERISPQHTSTFN